MTGSPRIRVLIVDDSVVVRQVVSDALKSQPDIDVAGVADNGRVALSMLAEVQPHVVVLDLEMPVLDGFGFLDELRRSAHRPKVIVFSTLSDRGARATIDAMARGAHDYVCKPSGQRSLAATIERVRSELVPKLHALTARVEPGRPPSGEYRLRPEPEGEITAIAIGCSTGGPTALSAVFERLGRDVAVPVFIAQHMPAVFTRVLAQRLSQSNALDAREGEGGEHVQGGRTYLAPGDFHMRVERTARGATLALDQGPRENGCRPSVDVLFRSAAAVYGRGLLAIVLTGLGSDGALGAAAVRKAGGRVWVQDQATSAAWGMPGSVVAAGLADRQLALGEIGANIKRAMHGGASRAAPAPKRWADR